MKTARQAAVEALIRVETAGSWSNLALDSLIKSAGLSGRDAAFASALFYGTLERKITLDACIAAHSKTKPRKLSPVVKNILRLSIYQILYMDSVPDRAAVGEGVELAKTMKMGIASGFVNGVLRSFLRGGSVIPSGGNLIERTSLEYSAPEWLVKLWINSYGEEKAVSMLANSIGRPPQYIRANTLKITPDELIVRLAGEGCSATHDAELYGCLAVECDTPIHMLESHTEGLFHIQDKSSQLCVKALGVEPGQRVLDVCAAPGGKTFTCAEYLNDTGELVSAELHEKRVRLMEKEAERMGIRCMKAVQADMSIFHEEFGVFDRILCDVPCSGLGVIRRKPEIKYKNQEEFANLPEIQYKILEAASKYCRAGARLLYSTCTLNPAENSGVAHKFLDEHEEFSGVGLGGIVESWEHTFTGEEGGDGFYIALFEKR